MSVSLSGVPTSSRRHNLEKQWHLSSIFNSVHPLPFLFFRHGIQPGIPTEPSLRVDLGPPTDSRVCCGLRGRADRHDFFRSETATNHLFQSDDRVIETHHLFRFTWWSLFNKPNIAYLTTPSANLIQLSSRFASVLSEATVQGHRLCFIHPLLYHYNLASSLVEIKRITVGDVHVPFAQRSSRLKVFVVPLYTATLHSHVSSHLRIRLRCRGCAIPRCRQKHWCQCHSYVRYRT